MLAYLQSTQEHSVRASDDAQQAEAVAAIHAAQAPEHTGESGVEATDAVQVAAANVEVHNAAVAALLASTNSKCIEVLKNGAVHGASAALVAWGELPGADG